MFFIDLINSLNDKFHLDLQDDKVKHIILTINEDTEISLYSKDNGASVLIECDVYELEDFLQKDFFQHLLAANFEGVLPWGAYFVLNPDTKRLVLVKTVLLEHLNIETFLKSFQEFLSSQESVRERLYHWKTESFLKARRQKEMPHVLMI